MRRTLSPRARAKAAAVARYVTVILDMPSPGRGVFYFFVAVLLVACLFKPPAGPPSFDQQKSELQTTTQQLQQKIASMRDASDLPAVYSEIEAMYYKVHQYQGLAPSQDSSEIAGTFR